jgi:glycosyltransferase involved in cell wall biosynthesis
MSDATTPVSTAGVEQPSANLRARNPLSDVQIVVDPIVSAVPVSVVIPTLNEAKNLPHVLARIPGEVAELIIVDGHSTDGTTELARELWPGVRIIYQSGTGRGNALSAGFRAATGDIIVMLDADGSTDPAEIPRFVATLLTGADFAKGTRFTTGGGTGLTWFERLGNRMLTSIVNRIWSVDFSDLRCSYNAFWRRHLPLVSPGRSGFDAETLMSIRLARSDLRIVEVPSFEADRLHPRSNPRNRIHQPDAVSEANRDGKTRSVCLVGSSTYYLSGISYYTYCLAAELRGELQVSAILMRKLVPKALYPGRHHVGVVQSAYQVAAVVPTYEGIDWYSPLSVWRAAAFLRAERPDVLLLQWWTGANLPAYLCLAWVARHIDAKVVIEFHEDLDSAEAGIPVVGRLLRRGQDFLAARAQGYIAHSQWDRDRLIKKLPTRPGADFAVIRHGPYEMAGNAVDRRRVGEKDSQRVNLLFFGTIRPYKGLEYLVRAFNLLMEEDPSKYRLTVVGEPWERWTLPLQEIEKSAYRDHITSVYRYVDDSEVASYFDEADIVVLPYLKSSASGPLQLAMSSGLPVVVTEVGGLTEVAEGYPGAVLVETASAESVAAGVVAATALAGSRHAELGDWREIAAAYRALCEDLSREAAR